MPARPQWLGMPEDVPRSGRDLLLAVDTSGSMGYAGRTVSKFEYARRLAAALSYLMISQRDAVGLVTLDTEFRSMIPPKSAPGQGAPARA